MNLALNAKQALDWLLNHSKNYIYVSDKNQIPYPEVTGYLIPTLISIGLKSKAKEFAEYLINIQNTDGSWSFDNKKYIFDTSQIIHGLSYLEGYKKEIELGLDYVLHRLKNKQLDPNQKVPCHIYPRVIWAIKTTGYDVSRLINDYCSEETKRFNCNSHFWGYSFEGHAQLGLDCYDFLKIASQYDGRIPEKSGLRSYCFTGLNQTALSLFLLNKFDLGINALNLSSSFQCKNGGFYGSNGNYFKDSQISWAVKFYLDAFVEGSRLKNNLSKDSFKECFESNNDPRFEYVKNKIKQGSKVLDVGCGKGRYINNLNCERYACDLYETPYLKNTKFKIGSCLDLPYQDEYFDSVICCEALDLTPFYENAINEMLRVIKKNGSLIIIEKEGLLPTKSQFNEVRINFNKINSVYEIKPLTMNNSKLNFIGVEIRK